MLSAYQISVSTVPWSSSMPEQPVLWNDCSMVMSITKLKRKCDLTPEVWRSQKFWLQIGFSSELRNQSLTTCTINAVLYCHWHLTMRNKSIVWKESVAVTRLKLFSLWSFIFLHIKLLNIIKPFGEILSFQGILMILKMLRSVIWHFVYYKPFYCRGTYTTRNRTVWRTCVRNQKLLRCVIRYSGLQTKLAAKVDVRFHAHVNRRYELNELLQTRTT